MTVDSPGTARPKCLVIGACDARRLGHWLSTCGFDVASYTPESTLEVLKGNERIEEVFHYFESRGIDRFLKTERVPIRTKLVGCQLAVIIPFFEYAALHTDKETDCVFTLRVLESSHYWPLLRRHIIDRFEPFAAAREQYHLNLANSIQALALDFPTTHFIILLHGYPPERFGPNAFYNCPFVSNTYEDYFLMAEEARAILRPRFQALRNMECLEMQLPFLELMRGQGARHSEIFPFFVPAENGRSYRRDIAHISECALRALAERIAGSKSLEEGPIGAVGAPHAIQVLTGKLQSGKRDLWANVLEDSMVSGRADQVTDLAAEALCSALSSSPEDPSLLLMIYAYAAFLRHARIQCGLKVQREIHRYFFSKDLEYGAWKKFFAFALEALAPVS